MTSLAQVKAAINTVISQINEQNGLINDFKSTNSDNMTLVTSPLQGGHEQTMLTALRRANDSLNKAQQALRQAEQSAKKVTNI